jgi:hypothetical protein
MRYFSILAALFAVSVSGCSSPGVSAGGSSGETPATRATIVVDTKKPLITPAYIYIDSEGGYNTFEVDGRKAKNAAKWTSKTNCKKKVDFVFDGYNAQGSSYTAYGDYPGTCTYTVTNPRKRSATLTIQISSD